MTPRTGAALRVCIVSSAHVASNPRLVKEADALTAAGHAVRVVTPLHHAALAAVDDELLRQRRWRLTRVDVSRRGAAAGRVRWLRNAMAGRMARLAFDAGVRWRAVADRAISRHVGDLAREAAREPADLVIAHNLPALPAAARAAERLGARLAFDAEDLHVGELPDAPEFASQRALVTEVDAHYLPRCDVLVASSDGIADELVRRYGVPRPTVVFNAFPRAERVPPPEFHPVRTSPEPSLYWFSMVIGPDRGIEDALAAMARLDVPVQLHLRGRMMPGYRERLDRTIAEHGLTGRVHIWPEAVPHALVAYAAEHDVGLALERDTPLNRDLAVANKLFTYLVAGLAIAATDTRGQRGVLTGAPGAGFLFPPGDPDALARGLRRLVADPAELARARSAARRAADDRYSWEHEAPVLVETLTGAGARSSTSTAA